MTDTPPAPGAPDPASPGLTGALARLSAAVGILPRYKALSQEIRETHPDAARAMLAAMDIPAGTEAEARDALAALASEAASRALPDWAVLEVGAPARLTPVAGGDWALMLEDGTIREGRAVPGALDLPGLPLGIHRLELRGAVCWLLAAPAALPLPPRGWGITLPFYGLRDAARGGLADYRDLGQAVAGLGGLGAGFVGINPIHAGFPTDPGAISPYSPSSRRRLDIRHIAVEGEAPAPGEAMVDWPPAVAERLALLRARFEALGPEDRAALDAWRAAEGDGLELFARHQAIADAHGPYWTAWPTGLRDPASPEVAAFAAAQAENVAFHAWAQMEAEAQLSAVRDAAQAAGMAQGLYLDLAVGTHPAGAETWAEPANFARGVSLGAPPDDFAPQGQRWGLAPMDPRALVRAGFAPLAETLRAQLRFAGLLRIDHILGFERAFWAPENAPGAYLAMPRAAMLAVARIEAARAGATIVGEDLGVIPEGLRDALAEAGLLGCRLAMFDGDLAAWPGASLASFGTHDLPPYAAWLEGTDIALHEDLGHMDAAAASRARTERAARAAELSARAGGPGLDALHRMLGGAPSALAALQAEDILGATAQANLPGTVTEHPNWRRRVGVAPGDLGAHPAFARAARIMRESGR